MDLFKSDKILSCFAILVFVLPILFSHCKINENKSIERICSKLTEKTFDSIIIQQKDFLPDDQNKWIVVFISITKHDQKVKNALDEWITFIDQLLDLEVNKNNPDRFQCGFINVSKEIDLCERLGISDALLHSSDDFVMTRFYTITDEEQNIDFSLFLEFHSTKELLPQITTTAEDNLLSSIKLKTNSNYIFPEIQNLETFLGFLSATFSNDLYKLPVVIVVKEVDSFPDYLLNLPSELSDTYNCSIMIDPTPNKLQRIGLPDSVLDSPLHKMHLPNVMVIIPEKRALSGSIRKNQYYALTYPYEEPTSSEFIGDFDFWNVVNYLNTVFDSYQTLDTELFSDIHLISTTIDNLETEIESTLKQDL